MPVLTVGGEKKKVACGPCIRGHRSSKCAHKDRVLIEVRKPGRPLGTCPHPAGSCGCERVVINYMIPKDRASSSVSQGLSPASAASSRVQKSSTSTRSVANLPQATVDKVLSGDASALAVLANYPSEEISTSSDTSSQPPSVSSSASATPKIDPRQDTQITDFPKLVDGRTEKSDGPRNLLAQAYGDSHVLNRIDGNLPDSPSQPKPCCCGPSASETKIDPLATPSLPPSTPFTHQTTPHPSTFAAPHAQTPAYLHDQMAYGIPDPQSDFPSFEFDIGCGGMSLPTNSISQRMMGHQEIACTCGDTCQCFACMTHPKNRTTVDYVRYHNELLSQASYFDHAAYASPPILQNQHSMYQNSHPFGHTPQPHDSRAFPAPSAPHIYHHPPLASHHVGWPAQQAAPQLVPHTPVSELESLHFPLYTDLMSPTFLAHDTSATQAEPFERPVPVSGSLPSSALHTSARTQPMKQQGSVSLLAGPFDADSPLDEDASTLSPSSFLMQQFSLPGCDDVTGTCQCGEGCACEGCLTHDGHAEVASLEDHKPLPTLLEQANDNAHQSATKKSCCG